MNNKIKFVQWNIRGIKPQKPYLQMLIDDLSPSLISIQETHLKPKDDFYVSKYHYPILRNDRKDQMGGGVALLIKKEILFTPIHHQIDAELIAAKIYIKDKSISICSIYFAPNVTTNHIKTVLDSLKEILTTPYIIMMDSNSHHPSWGSENTDNKGNLIADWIEENSLILLNTGEPTYMSSGGSLTHIDLTICTPDLATDLDWTPHYDLYNSDHFPIMIGTTETETINNDAPKWNIDKADWKLFTDNLKLDETFDNPHNACDQIVKTFKSAAENAIPLKLPQKTRPSSYWWTAECTKRKKDKNKALYRYKKQLGNLDLWIAFKKARAKFRITVHLAKRNSWNKYLQNFTSNNNSSQMWKRYKILKNKPTSRTIVLKIDNEYVTEQRQIANKLAEHFSEKSKNINEDPFFLQHKSHCEKTKITFDGNDEETYNLPFTIEELNYALNSCTSKSPGPDSLPYSFIKNITKPQMAKLLDFYNFIYRVGYPEQWSEGLIIPLLKSQKISSKVESYRPITLTNTLGKLMEKMVNRRLQNHLEKMSFYSNSQSGFRASHSTYDGLIRLQHSAHEALTDKKFCVAVFLDISKAFDTVWHQGLLTKIKNLDIKGNMGNFIQSFLQNRKISVKVNNTISNHFNLEAGVPQGSVLSPTLFTIYINDIFENISPNIQTSLFADDGAIWIVHDKLDEAILEIQAALDTILHWSQEWGLKIAHDKTNALIFTRRHIHSPNKLTFDNKNINYVTSTKFLGIHFDSKLIWCKHIDYVVTRCKRDLQLMRLISYSKFSSDYLTLLKIYTMLIRPKIDYGCFLYMNAAKTHLTKLDRIQYEAARIMLGVLRTTPTFKLEIEANLMPLNIRRKEILVKYGFRICTIPCHPVKLFIDKYKLARKFVSPNYKFSPMQLVKEEFDTMEVELNMIPSIQMTERYSVNNILSLSSLAILNKSKISEDLWRLLFKDLTKTKYNQRTHVYTDGSKTSDSTGSAVWSESFSLLCKLPKHTSVFTAELYAIYAAISFLSNQAGYFVIFTDSLSSINALKSLNHKSHYLLSKIHQKIQAMPDQKVVLEWVPSHVGIIGNEKADSLAMTAHNLAEVNHIQIPEADARKITQAYYQRQWQKSWTALGDTLTEFKPNIRSTDYQECPRHIQIPLTRIRLNAPYFKYEQYIKQRSSPRSCTHCNIRLTLKHILIDCPDSNQYRNPITRECQKLKLQLTVPNIANQNFPSSIIYNFLKATNYLHLI